jgi:photosynthetic reaction center M subunit
MQYQNIFTQVQVRGPVEAGIPLPRGDDERVGTPFYNWLAGWFGNAQIGPVYLGFLGTASLIAGTIWFVIVGFNMLASVGWDPIQFIRQLFWLALEPPPAKYGLSIVPPLNEGGWYIISSVFLLAAVLLWWARIYVRARALGLGTHVFWAFGAAIWLFLVLGCSVRC